MHRILLTDDNSDYRHTVMEILRLEGYEVIEASNGVEALELARSQQPEFILCDIEMPLMNGFEVLTAVRADPALAATPFFLVTARMDDEFVARGKALGANDYLLKPMNVSLLRRKLRAYLGDDAPSV